MAAAHRIYWRSGHRVGRVQSGYSFRQAYGMVKILGGDYNKKHLTDQPSVTEVRPIN